MIENSIEEFQINNCPLCGKNHNLRIDVYRDMLPNDIDQDIRVPEFKQISLRLICPVKDEIFGRELLIQEDIYSRLIKLRRPE